MDAEEWRIAAWRMKGLAASFGAVRLMALAEEGVAVAPRDPAYLRRIRQAVARLSFARTRALRALCQSRAEPVTASSMLAGLLFATDDPHARPDKLTATHI